MSTLILNKVSMQKPPEAETFFYNYKLIINPVDVVIGRNLRRAITRHHGLQPCLITSSLKEMVDTAEYHAQLLVINRDLFYPQGLQIRGLDPKRLESIRDIPLVIAAPEETSEADSEHVRKAYGLNVVGVTAPMHALSARDLKGLSEHIKLLSQGPRVI